MKTMIYWTCTHVQRAACDLRFTAKLWWIKQQVEVVEWRWRLKMILPSSTIAAEPQPTREGVCHAMQPLSVLHG